MKRTLVFLMILLLYAVPADAQARGGKVRTVELTLYPAKAPEPAQKYQLLPKADEQTDADAVPLYKKAVQSLPKNFQRDQISKWVRTSLSELPREQARSTLQQLKPTLQLLEQAAKCKHCKWLEAEDDQATDELMQDLSKYRQIIYILALQTRFQIVQGRYDKAIATVQTGFAMATHLGEGPTLVQGLMGISLAAFMYQQLEQFVQPPNAPNLYWALQRLPRPLVDLTEQIELEMPDPDVKRRITLLMSRLDRHVTALQCIEALRLYAAAHDGKFPNALSDITEVPIPSGPATKKPFVYQRSGSKAVLEAPAPEGATAKDAIRYELNLKE